MIVALTVFSQHLLSFTRLMAKLKQTMRLMLDSEEAKEVTKTYTGLLAALRDFEASQYEAWGAGVEEISQSKLKQPLLTRDDETLLLHVNFDPALVRLLREVTYFKMLDKNIPKPAAELNEKNETFRVQMGNLQLVVGMYNQMLLTMLDVERPLLAANLELDRRRDAFVERGVTTEVLEQLDAVWAEEESLALVGWIKQPATIALAATWLEERGLDAEAHREDEGEAPREQLPAALAQEKSHQEKRHQDPSVEPLPAAGSAQLGHVVEPRHRLQVRRLGRPGERIPTRPSRGLNRLSHRAPQARQPLRRLRADREARE